MRVLRTACCAFALTTLASSIAVRDARAQDDDCDKNHYILDVDCRPLAVSVPIGNPGAIVADPVGHVYFSSQNVVFRIDPEGRLTRVAGTGLPGFAGDGGPASKALLNIPWQIGRASCRKSVDLGGRRISKKTT